MLIRDQIRELATKAKAASRGLRSLSSDDKNVVLCAWAQALEVQKSTILAANAEDVAVTQAAGLSPALIDRLTLTEARFQAMVDGVRQVAALPDPVGELIWERTQPSGITIQKLREPLGVVAVVFESRPNVLVDTAALCLKTSNAIVLRGGKEAIRSNTALARVLREALPTPYQEVVQFIDILDHEAVPELVRQPDLIDVAIPRGGERLIRAMCEAALIPVLKHYKGVCHLYVDDQANLPMALTILDNAKRQRPSACNAVECLLVQETLAPLFLPMVKVWAQETGVTLHEAEVGTEYLSLNLNVATVKDYRAAIDFINRHSSHHSDAIITDNPEHAAEFLRDVDSACVYHNTSTRFTDGAEFGMGAEIGISTDKLHARGPMGLEELTTYKYRITSDGTIRN